MKNRLLLLGDSIMKGVVYNGQRGRYAMYDDSCFLKEAESRGIQIVKVCKMGATVKYGLDNISDNIHGGDTVLVEFGGNDSNYNWLDVASDPDAEHTPNTPPERFCDMYSEIICKIRSLGAIPVAVNLAPISSESFFRWISKTADGSSVLKWLGDVNMLYRWHEYYNTMVERVASKNDCPIVDIRGYLLRTHNFCRLLSDDGMHPNDEGHTLIRRILLDTVC